jgi:RNA polymerase sigma factor (sigma-70 family)
MRVVAGDRDEEAAPFGGNGHSGGCDAAERAVRGGYERLKPSVLATLERKLRNVGLRVERGDLEDFYNLAWHALYERLRDGASVSNPAGFIVEIAYRRAIDDHRRSQLVPTSAAVAPERAAEPDLAARMDDSARLAQLFGDLRNRLDRRERAAVSLCYLRGYSRSEVAYVLGVDRRRIEKIMDGATRKLAVAVQEIASGMWCENHASLVRAFALGLLDPGGERHRLALAHLRICPPCRHQVLVQRHAAALKAAEPRESQDLPEVAHA